MFESQEETDFFMAETKRLGDEVTTEAIAAGIPETIAHANGFRLAGITVKSAGNSKDRDVALRSIAAAYSAALEDVKANRNTQEVLDTIADISMANQLADRILGR